MAVEYTVYVNIEAYDESKRYTNEDDCWHPLPNDRNLGVFDDLKDAEQFMDNLPVRETL